MTIATLAQLMLTDFPADHSVAVRSSQQLYWRDFKAAVAALALQLTARTERRWALFHADSYTFAIGFFALLHSGKTVVLPANAQPGTAAELSTGVEALLGQFPTSAALPILSIDEKAVATFAWSPLSTTTAAIELMTSGSTGGAKIVHKTIAQLAGELICQNNLWGARIGDATVLATVSHQHIYGLLFRLLWPLCSGRPFAALPYQYWEPLFADLAGLQRAVLISSPAHLKRLPAARNALADERLLAVFSSGSALPTEVLAQWREKLHAAPIEIFGSSESGGIAYRHALQTDRWTPLPTVQCRIDADGLLQVQSPFVGGSEFIATGDRAQLHADGEIELLGRADQIIKLEEKRISLTDMTARLCAHVWIKDARIILLPGERASLGAVVELTANGWAQLQTCGKREFATMLRAHLLQFFERAVLPRKWRYVEQLPSNSQGKIIAADLHALFAASRADNSLPGTVVRASDGEIVIAIDTTDRELFAGHFPDVPILPGVLQLDWAIRHSRQHWYADREFIGIDQLKFQQVIVPDLALQLKLKNCDAGRVDFSFCEGEDILSQGRIRFEAGDGI